MGASTFFTAAMIGAFRQGSLHIEGPMLMHVWQELEYRIDVCRVTRGANTEHLWLSKKKTFSVFLWV
jgi:hypothetical protein